MAEFWMHYVGSQLYPVERFEKEAARLGVQRAVQFGILKNFAWGTPILLATYIGRDESAEVFGYFIISGITSDFPIHELPLDIVQIKSGNYVENRACGSYAVGGVYQVRNTIMEIMDKVKIYCKEKQVNPNNYKWFLKGTYHRLENPILLKPAKFTRGYMKIKFDGIENLSGLQETAKSPVAVYIYNYKKRTYLSKSEAAKLDMKSLKDFM